MQGIGSAIEEALGRLIVCVAVICTVMGGLLVWGLPKLWSVVKPWIHSVTN